MGTSTDLVTISVGSDRLLLEERDYERLREEGKAEGWRIHSVGSSGVRPRRSDGEYLTIALFGSPPRKGLYLYPSNGDYRDMRRENLVMTNNGKGRRPHGVVQLSENAWKAEVGEAAAATFGIEDSATSLIGIDGDGNIVLVDGDRVEGVTTQFDSPDKAARAWTDWWMAMRADDEVARVSPAAALDAIRSEGVASRLPIDDEERMGEIISGLAAELVTMYRSTARSENHRMKIRMGEFVLETLFGGDAVRWTQNHKSVETAEGRAWGMLRAAFDGTTRPSFTTIHRCVQSAVTARLLPDHLIDEVPSYALQMIGDRTNDPGVTLMLALACGAAPDVDSSTFEEKLLTPDSRVKSLAISLLGRHGLLEAGDEVGERTQRILEEMDTALFPLTNIFAFVIASRGNEGRQALAAWMLARLFVGRAELLDDPVQRKPMDRFVEGLQATLGDEWDPGNFDARIRMAAALNGEREFVRAANDSAISLLTEAGDSARFIISEAIRRFRNGDGSVAIGDIVLDIMTGSDTDVINSSSEPTSAPSPEIAEEVEEVEIDVAPAEPEVVESVQALEPPAFDEIPEPTFQRGLDLLAELLGGRVPLSYGPEDGFFLPTLDRIVLVDADGYETALAGEARTLDEVVARAVSMLVEAHLVRVSRFGGETVERIIRRSGDGFRVFS